MFLFISTLYSFKCSESYLCLRHDIQCYIQVHRTKLLLSRVAAKFTISVLVIFTKIIILIISAIFNRGKNVFNSVTKWFFDISIYIFAHLFDQKRYELAFARFLKADYCNNVLQKYDIKKNATNYFVSTPTATQS